MSPSKAASAPPAVTRQISGTEVKPWRQICVERYVTCPASFPPLLFFGLFNELSSQFRNLVQNGLYRLCIDFKTVGMAHEMTKT